jgi:hypothetical protein
MYFKRVFAASGTENVRQGLKAEMDELVSAGKIERTDSYFLRDGEA